MSSVWINRLEFYTSYINRGLFKPFGNTFVCEKGHEGFLCQCRSTVYYIICDGLRNLYIFIIIIIVHICVNCYKCALIIILVITIATLHVIHIFMQMIWNCFLQCMLIMMGLYDECLVHNIGNSMSTNKKIYKIQCTGNNV